MPSGGCARIGCRDDTPPNGRRYKSADRQGKLNSFRWREMLENGTHATIAEIAAAEKINES